MDATTIRQHLRELNEKLSQLDDEREVVRNLIVGYEGWLRINAEPGEERKNGAAPASKVEEAPIRPRGKKAPRPSSRPKGDVSLNQAVLRVIRDGHGQPLHTREIAERARALGAITKAQKPERVVDLLLYSHRNRGGQPVERVGPLTWRWTGD